MSRPPTPSVARRLGPTDPAEVRRHNASLVLETVMGHGPLSRAQVATRTGLTRATAGSIVEELLAAGLLAEAGTSSRGGVGRPGTDVVVDPRGAVGVGLEISVDGLAVVSVDLTGAVVHQATDSGDQRSRPPDDVIADAAVLVDRALAAADDDGAVVRGVGVAVPGLVDLDAQTLRVAPNLGWEEVAVVDRLKAAADRPWPHTVLDNEANLAALGELWSGDHGDTDSFVLVNGGVGVGAGVVLDGRLHRGTRGFSGELGHLTVAPDGPECRCGARGCLEQAAGLDRLLRGTDLESSSGGAAVAGLVSALEHHDRRAGANVLAAGTSLGVGVAALVNLFDVDTVVLGGVYAPLFPWLEAPLHAALDRRVISARWAPITVAPSRLGSEAAVRGAARAGLREIVADPLGVVAAAR